MSIKRNSQILAYTLLSTVLLAACSSNAAAPAASATTTASSEKAVTSVTAEATAAQVSAAAGELVSYTEEDTDSSWEKEDATYIELNGSDAEVSGSGAVMVDKTVTIALPGVYVISGKLDDGQIKVSLERNGTVRLILNGVELTNSEQAAIFVEKADKTVITLQEGTENVVSDGENYVFANSEEDEPNAAIFSKDDLTINGNGNLTVNGNYNNGIVGKDNLLITGGNITVHSVDDGLTGRDLLAVKDGTITVDAEGDGLKSTNDADADKGNIVLEGGVFNITTGSDGIQAESDLLVAGGDFSITSGDDGLHANSALTISGGTIAIDKSYEGIESKLITISGGEIHVLASDDGINVAGGNDSSSVNGRPGQNTFSDSGDSGLYINGGYVAVNAAGDGLDSNGSIYMTDGTVLVSGPTNSGNGTLDYNGVFEMSGGFLIAAGSSGMAQAPSEDSAQNAVLMQFSSVQNAGTLVHLQDSTGKTIATFAPAKEYQTIVISSPELKKDTEYTLYTGGSSTGSEKDGLYTEGKYQGGTKTVSATFTNTVTYLTESGVSDTNPASGMGGGGMGNGNMGGGMGPGGPGGGRGNGGPRDGTNGGTDGGGAVDGTSGASNK